MEMHWVDYIIVVIIGLSIITGLFRGFVKELIALIVWALAIWLAYTYSDILNQYLVPYINDYRLRATISFILILIATLVAGALVNSILSFILKRSGLSGTDRLLGMGFGFIRGVFIVSLIMLMVRMADLPYHQYSSQSKLYAQFQPLVNWMYQQVPSLVGRVKGQNSSLADENDSSNQSGHTLLQDDKLVMAFDELDKKA